MLLILSACAAQQAERERRIDTALEAQRQSLLDKTPQELVSRFDVPDRRMRLENGVQLYEYRQRDTIFDTGRTRSNDCTVQLFLINGKVAKVLYRGADLSVCLHLTRYN